ncbi:MAG: acid--CoA ligase, partial [Acidimicrobiales bacterium]|nr:acid--CoA ligase [Acidimicrobiales bacterium]
WMRPVGRDRPTYRYIGADTEERDGWECLGDIGSLDEDGFLYLNDRRSDMILVGGANVFPAEVEAAINLHPGVASSAVIGLPDEDKGNTVHAIIEPKDPHNPPPHDDLMQHLAEHLVTYKLPRSIEYVDEPLRDDAGKVRRSQLRAARVGA